MGILGGIGGIIALIGWIWAIVNGFQKSGAVWGILNIIPIQPLIGIISAVMAKIDWRPVIVMLVGIVISMFGNFSGI